MYVVSGVGFFIIFVQLYNKSVGCAMDCINNFITRIMCDNTMRAKNNMR